MRKYFNVLLFTILTHYNVNAQERGELSIGVGDGIAYEFFFEFESIVSHLVPSMISGHSFTEDVSVNTPYLFLDYRKPLSDRLKVGGQIGYYAYNGTTTEYSVGQTVYDVYDVKKSVFVLMPGIDYSYIQRNKFRFYGNLMLGIGIASSEVNGTMDRSKRGEENNVLFAFQVNPIGLSYGDQFKVFAEGGIGISLVNAGIRFKL